MNTPPVGTGYLLKRAELAVRSCMEVALAEFDLTPAQFLLMFRLRASDNLSAAKLAREIGVRPQSVSGIIAPLEQKRLLKRVANPSYRRILHSRLTRAGSKLVAKAIQAAGSIEAELLTGLDDKQVTALQQALADLWERAEKHEPHPCSMRARARLMTASWMDPVELGAYVVEGIRNNAPYIFTHAEFREEVRGRYEELDAAFPREQLIPVERNAFEDQRRDTIQQLLAHPVKD